MNDIIITVQVPDGFTGGIKFVEVKGDATPVQAKEQSAGPDIATFREAFLSAVVVDKPAAFGIIGKRKCVDVPKEEWGELISKLNELSKK